MRAAQDVQRRWWCQHCRSLLGCALFSRPIEHADFDFAGVESSREKDAIQSLKALSSHRDARGAATVVPGLSFIDESVLQGGVLHDDVQGALDVLTTTCPHLKSAVSRRKQSRGVSGDLAGGSEGQFHVASAVRRGASAVGGPSRWLAARRAVVARGREKTCATTGKFGCPASRSTRAS